MTESQIKAQVGSLVKQGLPRKKSVSKSKISPQKKAWETRRARMVEKEKPTVIEFNGLTIEIHAPMLGRVITIQNDNLIKII
jgi:hypothetical protein